MRYVFDLDETLCTGYPYEGAIPLISNIAVVNHLKNEGHTIIINTARGGDTCNGNTGKILKKYGLLTLQQLKDWEINYDEIYFGKPGGDIYIDNKGENAISYFSRMKIEIEKK